MKKPPMTGPGGFFGSGMLPSMRRSAATIAAPYAPRSTRTACERLVDHPANWRYADTLEQWKHLTGPERTDLHLRMFQNIQRAQAR